VNFTLITCTCDRPEAFAICEKYIARQTLKPVQWIVLDDGTVPVRPTMGQTHVYLPECRGPGSMVSKLRQLLSSDIIAGDAVAFIEDDDAYTSDWLEWCSIQLDKYEMCGEGKALYYNVAQRYWYKHENMAHASLCTTAVRKSLLPLVQHICQMAINPFIDVTIWRLATQSKFLRDPDQDGGRRRVIGIKAMPGKVGYGHGHVGRDRGAADDRNLAKLMELIGDDAVAYAPFMKDAPPVVTQPYVVRKDTCGDVHGPNWLKWLDSIKGKSGVEGLELGTWKGESAEWMLDNIFTNPQSRYTCIDTFKGSPEHHIRGINTASLEMETRMRLGRFRNAIIISSRTDSFLKKTITQYDFVYVDADHSSRGVLCDAVGAFQLLKIGGVMVFDDYTWEDMPDVLDRPKTGIDAFMACFAKQIEILGIGYQVAIKKICHE
jgi:predicted O-methyltransferase YrrM